MIFNHNFISFTHNWKSPWLISTLMPTGRQQNRSGRHVFKPKGQKTKRKSGIAVFMSSIWDFALQLTTFHRSSNAIIFSPLSVFAFPPILWPYAHFLFWATPGFYPPPQLPPPTPHKYEGISVIYSPQGLPVILTTPLWMPRWHPNSTERRSRPPSRSTVKPWPLTSTPGEAGRRTYCCTERGRFRGISGLLVDAWHNSPAECEKTLQWPLVLSNTRN